MIGSESENGSLSLRVFLGGGFFFRLSGKSPTDDLSPCGDRCGDSDSSGGGDTDGGVVLALVDE